MQRFEDKTDELKQQVVDLGDSEFEEALKDFKSSVHVWSDAAYSRPRTVTHEVRVRSWRLAAGWALGCVLVAGSVSGRRTLSRTILSGQGSRRFATLSPATAKKPITSSLEWGFKRSVMRNRWFCVSFFMPFYLYRCAPGQSLFTSYKAEKIPSTPADDVVSSTPKPTAKVL